MLDKQDEVRRLIKEEPFTMPFKHIMNVLGLDKQKAKEHYKLYYCPPTRWW